MYIKTRVETGFMIGRDRDGNVKKEKRKRDREGAQNSIYNVGDLGGRGFMGSFCNNQCKHVVLPSIYPGASGRKTRLIKKSIN